jgi:hypothetical protein
MLKETNNNYEKAVDKLLQLGIILYDIIGCPSIRSESVANKLSKCFLNKII